MERQIKFRAWDNVNNVMELNVHHLDSLNEILHKDKYNVMQFTGLKDKNGVDIYEGDILAFENTLNFKTVLQNYFEIKWEDYGNGMVGFTQFSPINKCVVVGNIYENPNLLQDGK